MKMQTTGQPSVHEQTVLKIMRRLPPERVLQLVDFTRFLEFQATPGAKRVMHEVAREAREGYRAGQTTVEGHAMIWVREEEIEQDLPTYLQRVEAGETLVIIKAGKPMAEIKPVVSVSESLRPFGLCAGEFTVPNGFDDPLPEHIIQEFEGR